MVYRQSTPHTAGGENMLTWVRQLLLQALHSSSIWPSSFYNISKWKFQPFQSFLQPSHLTVSINQSPQKAEYVWLSTVFWAAFLLACSRHLLTSIRPVNETLNWRSFLTWELILCVSKDLTFQNFCLPECNLSIVLLYLPVLSPFQPVPRKKKFSVQAFYQDLCTLWTEKWERMEKVEGNRGEWEREGRQTDTTLSRRLLNNDIE